eukprot:scaffold2857_cov183-Skeletonema_marinoi.AAC.4
MEHRNGQKERAVPPVNCCLKDEVRSEKPEKEAPNCEEFLVPDLILNTIFNFLSGVPAKKG